MDLLSPSSSRNELGKQTPERSLRKVNDSNIQFMVANLPGTIANRPHSNERGLLHLCPGDEGLNRVPQYSPPEICSHRNLNLSVADCSRRCRSNEFY